MPASACARTDCLIRACDPNAAAHRFADFHFGLLAQLLSTARDPLSGRVALVATVAKRGAGFIAEVKRREDCELWTLDRANRDAIPAAILTWLANR
jgi:hypothetical protein